MQKLGSTKLTDMVSDGGPIATVDGIDLTTVGMTDLFVVPVGMTLICTGFTIRPSVVVSSAGNGNVQLIRESDSTLICSLGVIGSVIGVGQNLQSTPAADNLNFPMSNILAGDIVLFQVVAKDTGTTNTVSVDLFGYFV